jgi:catechol 2,3-dioxygenase-like lactoylglutathione lyase family enzyme
VYAIMPGDPGEAGRGHTVNYRVDDLDSIVASLHDDGAETSAVTIGPDATGRGKFVRLHDPEGHRVELWQHTLRMAPGTQLMLVNSRSRSTTS